MNALKRPPSQQINHAVGVTRCSTYQATTPSRFRYLSELLELTRDILFTVNKCNLHRFNVKNFVVPRRFSIRRSSASRQPFASLAGPLRVPHHLHSNLSLPSQCASYIERHIYTPTVGRLSRQLNFVTLLLDPDLVTLSNTETLELFASLRQDHLESVILQMVSLSQRASTGVGECIET